MNEILQLLCENVSSGRENRTSCHKQMSPLGSEEAIVQLKDVGDAYLDPGRVQTESCSLSLFLLLTIYC